MHHADLCGGLIVPPGVLEIDRSLWVARKYKFYLDLGLLTLVILGWSRWSEVGRMINMMGCSISVTRGMFADITIHPGLPC